MQTDTKPDHLPDAPFWPVRIRMVCAVCGSDNCGRDATARWDEEAQAWDLGGVFDNSWCDGCGHDDPGLDEVQIGEGEAPRDGALLKAARLVIARWESGDLAGAVRQLSAAIDMAQS